MIIWLVCDTVGFICLPSTLGFLQHLGGFKNNLDRVKIIFLLLNPIHSDKCLKWHIVTYDMDTFPLKSFMLPFVINPYTHLLTAPNTQCSPKAGVWNYGAIPWSFDCPDSFSRTLDNCLPCNLFVIFHLAWKINSNDSNRNGTCHWGPTHIVHEEALLSPFHRWGKWGSEKLSNLRPHSRRQRSKAASDKFDYKVVAAGAGD